MDQSFKIAELINKKIKGELSPEESIQLQEWLKQSPENISLMEKLTAHDLQLEKLKDYESYDHEKAWNKLESTAFPKRTISLNSRFLRFAAAILFPVLIAGGFGYYFLSRNQEMTLATIDENLIPGSQKALLILSDGESIELNENETSSEIEDKGIRISRKKNKLEYSEKLNRQEKKELIFHELRTPLGGGYNLSLADGTEVWLNAGSSLKFPVEFTDSTREVYLEGEAYFDVSHNGKAFIVNTGVMDIRVLGTSFNVSAYLDDAAITTTLVEGKVKLEISDKKGNAKKSEILTPDKQAVLTRENSEINITEVNTSQFTSWMEGKLEFSNESLESVMKKLARWYDFEFSFENEIARNYHFTARINNQEKISSILEMLEMTTDVEFTLTNETIVIK